MRSAAARPLSLPSLPTSAPVPRQTLEPRVAAVGTALPPHRYAQKDLLAALEQRWRGRSDAKLRLLGRLHESVQVGSRCLALPLEAYAAPRTFGESNDAFVREGTALGAHAVLGALAQAGLAPEDVDAIFFTTVTGLAVPTIDARLVNVLGLRRDVRRVPMFGLGCVGGAAGVARVADYLRGRPEHAAVLLSVELCSLTLQDADLSVPNLVSSGLFGDGAAAVLMLGEDRARDVPRGPGLGAAPRVLDSKSAFYPDTERVMGWDIGETGFKVVLSADVPDVVRRYVGADVDAFLAEHGLARGDVTHWIAHPGGPKVIVALEEALDLPPHALDATRRSLQTIGNLSSASVLHVLADVAARARPGDRGVLMAMGPGFCAEMVLLQW